MPRTQIKKNLVGRTASELAELVRSGKASPVDVVRAHLDHIGRLDTRVGAFQLVRGEKALAEAEALAAREDLDALPLAGVPVAIKDNLDVAGEPTRNGSVARSAEPARSDHEVVERIRAAGAIVVGKTRVPELCIWGWTDGAFGIARNPWNLDRTPGGSSGGSAAAVAAGMVPLASGSDGGGSIRIPSAACGLFGIKPGTGVVTTPAGRSNWCGLSSNGPIGTTVDDVALALAAMSGRPDLGAVSPPPAPLRIAVSVKPPLAAAKVDPFFERAARETGGLLAGAGHAVSDLDPPYDWRPILAQAARAASGVAYEAREMDFRRLERRARPMVLIGRLVDRLGLVRDGQRDAWRTAMRDFFSRADILITPALAATPPSCEGWSHRGAVANARIGAFAPFTGPWNLAGYPAASVPAGIHPDGMPLAVQIVGPDGADALVMSVAKQLEALRPWARHAPVAAL